MDRRGILVDLVVALSAFGLSAILLVSEADDAGLRDPDLLAFGLLVVYSGSVVLRRAHPVVAVGLGLAAGLVYAGADYPLALTPVVALSLYSAGARLPEATSRRVLVGAVVLSALAATVGPGATSTSPPL